MIHDRTLKLYKNSQLFWIVKYSVIAHAMSVIVFMTLLFLQRCWGHVFGIFLLLLWPSLLAVRGLITREFVAHKGIGRPIYLTGRKAIREAGFLLAMYAAMFIFFVWVYGLKILVCR
jgi:hypothetical protein